MNIPLIGKLKSRMQSDRALFIQSVFSWGIRIVTTLLGFVNLKLLGACLDTDTFGSVLLIYGFLPWFSLLDFGFSPVAQNAIARAKSIGGDLGAITRFFLGSICLFSVLWISFWVFKADWVSRILLGEQSDNSLYQLFFLGGFAMIVIGLGSIGPRILLGSGRVVLSQSLSGIAALATSFTLLGLYLTKTAYPVAFV